MKRSRMNHIVFLTVGLLMAAQAAQAEDMFLKLSTYNNSRSWEVVSHEGVKVNRECAEKSATCQALQGYKIKPDYPPNTSGFAGHPADSFCRAIGQYTKVLHDTKRAQYNFCFFPDGSIISSWDLLNKRNKFMEAMDNEKAEQSSNAARHIKE